MKRHNIFILLCLAVALVAFAVNTRQQREARVRSELYVATLAQAPCIVNICPGFQGRERAFERLSESDMLEPKVDMGGAQMSFSLVNNEGRRIGGGALIFTTDASETVDKIYLRLPFVTLGTVLNGLGEPDEFLFIAGCGMGQRVHAKLFYLTEGASVHIDYPTRRPTFQVLTDETPISSIEYFSSSDFQDQIVNSLNEDIINSVAYDLHPSVTEEYLLRQIQSWPETDRTVSPTIDLCPR